MMHRIRRGMNSGQLAFVLFLSLGVTPVIAYAISRLVGLDAELTFSVIMIFVAVEAVFVSLFMAAMWVYHKLGRAP